MTSKTPGTSTSALAPTPRHPLTPHELAVTVRHLNERIDDMTSSISEKNVKIHQLTGLAYEVDSHRESITEMAHYLKILPRWRWIRRNRIRLQLATLAIAIVRRTAKG